MADVDVRFLGSGDSFGSGGRAQPCILVTAPGMRLLLDCGASSLIAMKQQGVDPNEIDAIVLSHFHGDHFAGLPFFILDAQFAKRARPLTIAGPPGVRERVRAAFDALYPGSADTRQKYDITYAELRDGVATTIGSAEITALPVAHHPLTEPRGLRVSLGGAVVAYSGDTAWTETLVTLAAGADLFICECYSFEKEIPQHLSYRALSRERERLRCGRIVVTHLGPEMLARRGESALEIAEDGTVIRL